MKAFGKQGTQDKHPGYSRNSFNLALLDTSCDLRVGVFVPSLCPCTRGDRHLQPLGESTRSSHPSVNRARPRSTFQAQEEAVPVEWGSRSLIPPLSRTCDNLSDRFPLT